MAKILKTWTTVGVALLGTATIANTAPLTRIPEAMNPAFILSDGEGGEGGGEAVTSYKLDSTDGNAFAYDAKPQISAYAAHVHSGYAAAKTAADDLASSSQAASRDD